MGIDQALLERQNIETQQQEQQVAGAVRMVKRQGPEGTAENWPPTDQSDYRALRHLAWLNQRPSEKTLGQEAVEKAKTISSAPVKSSTSYLLKQAWLNLLSSFGLTLAYIDFHILLRQIFPRLFCRLGEEWAPKAAIFGQRQAQKEISRPAGAAETLVLLLLNIIALALLIGSLVFLMLIIEAARKAFGWIDMFNYVFPF